MKWIYGVIFSAAGTIIKSYKIRPSDIVAIDLNNRQFYSKAIGWLWYCKDDEEQIINLMNEEK